jgi:hypothetical protein
VLKKNGFMVLCEPQKYNPFVEFGRKFIKNKETDRTITEHPLTPKDIRSAKKIFGNIEKKEFYLLTVGSLVFRDVFKIISLYKILYKIFYYIDFLLSFIPILRPLYWQVVFKVVKY